MRKAVSSKNLLAWLPNQVSEVLDVGGCCRSSLGRILSSRSFASDVTPVSTDAPPAAVDASQNPKDELGRWWQTFSEQRRAQAGNQQKTGKGRESNRRPNFKGNQLSDRGQQESSSREAGTNRWFIPKAEQKRGQEEPESLNKESISRWFLPKEKESSSTELERQEITSQQVEARWLASAREKSSTEPEPADPSSSRWFGFNKQPNQASERERLEVSMQRLALMSKLGDKSQTPSFMFLPPKDNLLKKYFHWDNLSSPEKHKVALTKVRESFALHKTDCGSSEVQIALLTAKIKYMTQHMATHRKDYHSRKGLEGMVQQRRKVLKYLRRKNWDSYCEVITKLGLRDNVMEPQKR